MENNISKNCFISGHVQGVSFRYYTRKQALGLGISGWARNLADGRVEVLACGEIKAVEKLCTWLHKGPPSAYVTEVNCQTIAQKEFLSGFEIS
ncbi:MAG: acylphosphatase [Gammaproteobacteria bacterium]|nr:MAG: acylphosphatase [Gammaproteobacteria bacterium]RKZ45231.1 MAG: acylphosphatase [Gammaproteobacteria bacterium]RKZ77203.1 MAG: acylphosphatase [Gammaproteobacteria bacterium]